MTPQPKAFVITPAYTGPERRAEPHMTPEQLDAIAELAASKAVDKTMEKLTKHIYAEVGKSVIQRGVWLVGVLAVLAYLGLRHLGLIK